MKQKAFWGILLLLTALSLILYGIGLGPSLLGMPIYKLILAMVLLSILFAKIFFNDSLRKRLKIFKLSALLFMILEPHIATWCSLSEENIINNWLLLLAAILIDISVGFILPKNKFGVNVGNVHIGADGICVGDNVHIGKKGVRVNETDGSSNFANSTIHYADVSDKRYHHYKTNMGNMIIYYQNADMVENGSVIELELRCNMGSIVVNVPQDWSVVDNIRTNMGSTVLKSENGGRVTLNVTGSNQMGSIIIQ